MFKCRYCRKENYHHSFSNLDFFFGKQTKNNIKGRLFLIFVDHETSYDTIMVKNGIERQSMNFEWRLWLAAINVV